MTDIGTNYGSDRAAGRQEYSRAMAGRARRQGNLPAELSTLVGRRRQLGEIKTSLAASRLVTLVGSGGVGKTRLALRAASELERAVADGAWLVELGGLAEPRFVPAAVMTALGLRDESGEWPLSRLVDHIGGKTLLLVLDNCEHLIDGCGVLTAALLRDCANLRVLATSRQPLGIAGERIVAVEPLSLPEADPHIRPERAALSEAVALLLERAGAAGADLELSERNVRAVVELVRHLDGIPLAVELAAVRLRSIGLDQLVERMDDRFHLLTGGSPAGPARQRTLKATIAWSHDLLEEEERVVLRRLSVFPASFTLDAAERVCTAGQVPRPDVVSAIAALVDRSFIAVEPVTAGIRYRMHETMRAFALVRLREAGEEQAARRAHLSFFAAMCRRAASDGDRADDASTLAALHALADDADDLRTALQRCLDDEGSTVVGLSMAAGLGRYWTNRALGEGAHWLDALLERPTSDDGARSRALFVRGYLSVAQGESASGLRAAAEAARIARASRDDVLLVRILAMEAALHVIDDDAPAGRRAAAEAKALASALDDDIALIAAAQSEALIASVDGDFVRTRDVGLAAVERCSRVHEVYMLSTHLTSAGVGAMLLGDLEAAEHSLLEALEATLTLDDRPGLVMRLQALAANAARGARAERAAMLLGATDTLRATGGYRVSPFIQPMVEQASAMAMAELGRERYARAASEGALLDRDGAVALALGTPVRVSAAPKRADPLSTRERQVAELAAEGLSNKAVASRLFVSERTVETHVSHVLDKLGIDSRSKIAGWLLADDA